MKYYTVKTNADLCLEDNYSKDNQSYKGALVFRKKRDALSLCEEMNEIAKRMKRNTSYKVAQFNANDMTDCGIILDGVWKKKL